MQLKYNEEIINCIDYNLSEFKEASRIAYRWVCEDISNEANFLPYNILCPKPEYFKKQAFWALSFFSNVSSSIARHKKLSLNKKNIDKKLGTHIAKGILKVSDGISNNHAKEGHFDFFEYEDVHLNNNFEIERKIDE